MKPRYFVGTGTPPIHVSDVRLGRHPQITFRGGAAGEQKIDFESKESFLALLFELKQQRVPFSVGGHCPGPDVALLTYLQEQGLNTSFVQISWYGPNQWEVREITENAKEWQEASKLEEIANIPPDAANSAARVNSVLART